MKNDKEYQRKANRKHYLKYRAKYQARSRANSLHITVKRYGLTVAQYNKVLEEQGHVCAICGKPETMKKRDGVRPLSIDHDHATGKFRGLLCFHCNTALGNFFDDPTLLERAVVYLNKGV